MVLKIIENMAVALNNQFPECKIYSERVKSTETKPCFFIILDRFSEKKVLANRYNQVTDFIITHYIDDLKTNESLITTANSVKDILEKIDGIDAQSISYRIESDALVFSVTYSYFIYKIKEKNDIDKMADITVCEGVDE